jgi:hypothetical protein
VNGDWNTPELGRAHEQIVQLKRTIAALAAGHGVLHATRVNIEQAEQGWIDYRERSDGNGGTIVSSVRDVRRVSP